MSEEKKEQSVSLCNQLQEIFTKKFGNDWRKKIKLEIRGVELYWFIHLAEKGLKAITKEFKEDKNSGVTEAASLASWQSDLEMLLDQIKKIVEEMK